MKRFFVAVSLLSWIFLPYTAFAQNSVDDRALAILDEEIDFSQSLFPPQDQDLLSQRIAQYRARIEKSGAGWMDLWGVSSLYKSIRDFDHTLALHALMDEIDAPDLSYRLDRADIYLRLGQVEKAVAELEPLKKDWPVPETFTLLAEAYKAMGDVPQEKIDALYREGIYRHSGQSDIVWAFIDWLEDSGREIEALPLYQQLYKHSPDPWLEQKIADLRSKIV